MVSFYDLKLSSLVDLHEGCLVGNQTFQNGWGLRRGHRIAGISKIDIEITKAYLRELTELDVSRCSGVAWEAIAENIIAQHKTRGLEIAFVLGNEVDTRDSALSIVTRTHEISHAILYPYLEYPFATGSTVQAVKTQTISRCSSVHTSHVKQSSLSRSEILLYRSINAVLDRMCRTEWDILEWSEQYTTQLLGERQQLDLTRIRGEILVKSQLMESILEWMGWNNWRQCERQCLINVSQYLGLQCPTSIALPLTRLRAGTLCHTNVACCLRTRFPSRRHICRQQWQDFRGRSS